MGNDLARDIEEIIDRLNRYMIKAMEMSSYAAQSEKEAASVLGSLSNNREFIDYVHQASVAGMDANNIIQDAINQLQSYLDTIY